MMKIVVPKWQLDNKNLTTIGLLVTIIAMENFFYLIPSDLYIIGGIKYSDIGLIFAWLWMLYEFIHFNFRFDKRESTIPILFYLIILLSSISGEYLLGQPILLTIRQNRYLLTCMALYYIVLNSMYFGELDKRDITKIFVYIAVAESVLYITQYFLGANIKFLNIAVDTRYGSARLRSDYLFILIFMYFCLGRLMSKKKYIFISLIGLMNGVYIMMVVVKNRAPVLIMLLTFLIAYLLWNADISKKVSVLFLLILVGVIFYHTSIIQDSINTIKYGDAIGTQNTAIREVGRRYYLQKIQQSPLLGYGEPNINYGPAYSESGANFNIFLADNGIFGFLYCHGLIGGIWLVLLFVQMFKQAFSLLKEKNEYVFILYSSFEFLNLYMGMHWYYYYALPFVLFLCILNYEYNMRRS
ncbi:O-antigen ligase family protein [Limosilactobacillus mucosae]|uniref:O-antigen ligase family protein n=1 Tax=Limosilactobacillus mucosae TaxID=97478 RepID=UPI003EBE5D7C